MFLPENKFTQLKIRLIDPVPTSSSLQCAMTTLFVALGLRVRLACSSRDFKLRGFPFGRERRSLNIGSAPSSADRYSQLDDEGRIR